MYDIILILYDGNEVCDDWFSDFIIECFGIIIVNILNDFVFIECILMMCVLRC